MTWRTTDELLGRVRRQAEEQQRSLNEWVTLVLDAASDPGTAGSEAEKVRERLAQAGNLARIQPRHSPRPDERRLADARAAAGRGTPLSAHVVADRG